MKKLFLLLCSTVLGLGMMSAQSLGKQQFELSGGLNLSKWTVNDMPDELASKMRPGFRVGARFTNIMSSGFSQNIGVFFSNRNYQFKPNTGIKKADDAVSLNFHSYEVEIPIHLGYHFALSDQVAFFGEAGPFVSIGVGGKIKLDSPLAMRISNFLGKKDTEIAETDLYGDKGFWRRADVGLGMRVGVQFLNRFAVDYSFDYGFLNRFKKKSDGIDPPKSHAMNMGLSLSVLF